MRLKARIKFHEGKSNRVYKDSLNILTIDYGRNLEAVGLSDSKCDYLCEKDLSAAKRLASTLGVYDNLNQARQGVLIEMSFQMGNRVSKFKKFLSAAWRHEWDLAAKEMLDSRWHEQTPKRAEELAEIFRSGIDE